MSHKMETGKRDGVGRGRGGESKFVLRTSSYRSEVCHLPLSPLKHVPTPTFILRQQPSGFFCQILQDGAAFEDAPTSSCMVSDHGYFPVG